MGTRARRLRKVAVPGLVAALIAVLLSTVSTPAFAHTPHDDVNSVAMSPDFANDGVVLATAGGRLHRSSDGGDTWGEMSGGRSTAAKPKEIAFAPSDAERVYLATFGAGIYRSDDRGISWTQAATGLAADIWTIAVSSADPDLVFANSLAGDVYRTTDGGGSWTQLTHTFTATAVIFTGDGTGRVVAADNAGRVHRSDDDGATWMTINVGSVKINTLQPVPGTATVFAGSVDGEVYRSDDAAASFPTDSSGLPNETVKSIAVSPDFGTDDTLWASMYEEGAYRSTDGGANWTHEDAGLTTDPQADQVSVAHFRRLAAGSDAGGDTVLFLAGFDGLFRSSDEGDNWEERQTLSEYVVGLAVSPDHAADSTLGVTTYVKGAYLSVDGGSSWTPSHVGLGHPLTDGNKYAPVRRMHNVVFSPDYANDQTVFSAVWTRVVKSTDGGYSWTEIPVAGSPVLRQYVLAMSPDWANDQTIFTGTRAGEIWRSQAGGDDGTWSEIADLGSRVRSLVVSPDYASDDTLFVGTVGGVHKSTDGGDNWTPTGPTTIAHVAISPEYDTDGTVMAGTEAGLFVTTNGGTSWAEVTDPGLPPSGHIEALAISPDFGTDGIVLVSYRGLGLFKSTDGGVTFSEISQPLIETLHVIGDFDNPTSAPIQFSPTFAVDNTVYAIAQREVLKSTDGGDTWSVLGLPDSSIFFDTPAIVGAKAPEATVSEGAGGTNIVRIPFDLTHPHLEEVTVQWGTLDNPGVEGIANSAEGDYVTASGSLTWEVGETRQWVEVEVLDDGLHELDELLLVGVFNPVNATVGAYFGLGLGTITDDDPMPTILPGGSGTVEGDTGSVVFDIPVTLSAPSGATVSVDWATYDVLAQPEPGIDYEPGTGTLTFPPGETAATVPITVYGDLVDEPGLVFDAEWGLVAYTDPENAEFGPGLFGAASLWIIIDDD